MPKLTLVFAVATLDLLMDAFLHLSFEDPCSGRLVKASYLQDVGCIDPIVRSSAHDMVGPQLEFIHRYLKRVSKGQILIRGAVHTLLYVAE